MHARDLMQTDVLTVPPYMSLPDLERKLLQAHVTGAPVVHRGKVLGVVSRSDIVKQISASHSIADHLATDYYQDISGFGHKPAAEQADIAERILGARLTHLCVKDAMVDNVIALRPDTPVAEIAAEMVNRGIHRVLISEDERLLGIITSLDLVRLLARPDVEVRWPAGSLSSS